MGTGEESGVMNVKQESRKGMENTEEGDSTEIEGIGSSSEMTRAWLQRYS